MPQGLQRYRFPCIYPVNQLSSYGRLCTNLVSLAICKEVTLLWAELFYPDNSLELEEGPHTTFHSGRKAIFANAK